MSGVETFLQKFYKYVTRKREKQKINKKQIN